MDQSSRKPPPQWTNWSCDRLDGTCPTEDQEITRWEKSFEVVAIIGSVILVILTFPITIFLCIRVVTEFERAVILRLGRLTGGVRGPGVVLILPCIDEFYKLDMRTATFDVEPQEILTKDSVTITVDAVVYYRIQQPLSVVLHVMDYRQATMLLGQTTLRNVAGQKMLSDLITQKEHVAHIMQRILDAGTDRWGVKVERVEIKDVRLPVNMQRAMAAEAEANREAEAKIAAADGEKAAANSLRDASEIISGNPTALQLRYLQTLNTISSERNSTIVFPFPIDMMSSGSREHSEGPEFTYNEAELPSTLDDYDIPPPMPDDVANNMYGRL